MSTGHDHRRRVRDRYTAAAAQFDSTPVGAEHYADETGGLPVGVSLGCGNPVAVADLNPGETVLDLGSGGGLDVLLSARRVGPAGRAIGLDLTPGMLDAARRHAHEAGVTNAEFLAGQIEEIPLPDNSVDVVISNCVITLSADKPRVFAEIARVLRPGGRIGISDVLAEPTLTDAERAAGADRVECLTGSLTADQYAAALTSAGLTDVELRRTHPMADKLYAAVVQARRPVADRPAVAVAVMPDQHVETTAPAWPD
jgi:SAM-dependent methyltransferase